MIYVLTSVNQNYAKYIERFSKSLIRTGAEIVPVFAIDSDSEDLRAKIGAEFVKAKIFPRIFYVQAIPSRFSIMKQLVDSLEEGEGDRYGDFITFIDIDDEVNETYFDWTKDWSLARKSLIISNVVKHYEDSELPYVSPGYLNFNPNDSYLSWGSLIWGKFYSLDLVKLFLRKAKSPDLNYKVYDFEHYCVYSLAMMAKLSSEGVGFAKDSTYIWNRHSGSLMTMSVETVSRIVNSVYHLLPNNKECCIESIYVSLLTSMASTFRASNGDASKVGEILEEFKSKNSRILKATFNDSIYRNVALKLIKNPDGSYNHGRFVIYEFLVEGVFLMRRLELAFQSDTVSTLNTGEFRKLHVLLRVGELKKSKILDIISDTDTRYIESGKVKFHFISNLSPLNLAKRLSKYARNFRELNLITSLVSESTISNNLTSFFEDDLFINDWVICISSKDYISVNDEIENLSKNCGKMEGRD